MAPAVLEHPGAWPEPLEGPDMADSTGTPGHSRDALEWLAAYRPIEVDPDRWAEVRRFVWESVCRLGWDSDSSAAWRVLRELARIYSWAASEGLPLDVAVVLDPETVERFIAVGLAGDPSRATYRSVLRRIGPLLTTTAPWQPTPVSYARRQVALAYSPKDLELLRADALVQPTPGRVRAARALLALGAGAGLDGRWVARVAAADVVRVGDAVLVSVGAPRRDAFRCWVSGTRRFSIWRRPRAVSSWSGDSRRRRTGPAPSPPQLLCRTDILGSRHQGFAPPG